MQSLLKRESHSTPDLTPNFLITTPNIRVEYNRELYLIDFIFLQRIKTIKFVKIMT